MHSSVVLTSLLVALAAAKPLGKRAYSTQYHTVTEWTTVTADVAAMTPMPDAASPAENVAAEEAPAEGYKPQENQAEPAAVPESSMSQQSEPTAVPSEAPQPEVVTPEAKPDTEGQGQAPAGEFAAQDSSESPAPAGGSYENNLLDAHNVHRANHSNTDAVTWSSKLAATAEKQIQRCEMIHDMTMDAGQYDSAYSNPYGQNIAFNSDKDSTRPIHIMYNSELGDHVGDFVGDSLPSQSGPSDHYTQMVWQDSKEVGCASRVCTSVDYIDKATNTRKTSTDEKNGLLLTFCNYFPAGNIGGEFQNVGKPLNDATVGPSD